MKLKRLRAPILSVCCAVPLLVFGSYAAADPTLKLAGGYTSVELSDQFTGALGALKVDASSIRPARLKGGVAWFPIPSGSLDLENARGEVSHTGGLRLRAGDTVADLGNFVIDTSGDAPVLTGSVIANGDYVNRIPLFDIKLPALQLPLTAKRSGVKLAGAELTLNSVAAGALNSVFGIKDFTGGLPIGTATIQASARDNSRSWRFWW